jgi:hypothetical protein
MFGKYAPHDIFVDLDAKGVSDLLGDTNTTELRIAVLHLDDGRGELRGRAFRARRFVFGMKRRTADGIFDGLTPCGT